jgi:hypothetical protein
VATTTDSSTADADFRIEDASPFSQGVTGDLKKKVAISSGNRAPISDSYVGHCPCLKCRLFSVATLSYNYTHSAFYGLTILLPHTGIQGVNN